MRARLWEEGGYIRRLRTRYPMLRRHRIDRRLHRPPASHRPEPDRITDLDGDERQQPASRSPRWAARL